MRRSTIGQGRRSIPTTNFIPERIPFEGGLNQTTPPIELKPGEVIDSENFDCDINGGYRWPAGYERFDGQTSPSSANYYTLPATVTGSWTLNNTVTGATSGATAKVVGETDNGLLVANISGTFTNGENLQISAVTIAVCSGSPYIGGADTIANDAAYTNLAADVYRALISAVPGSGSVLGVCFYNGALYAFRNNAGGTAAVMHKSTTSGWSAITFDNKISFNTGVVEPSVGDTLTGGTSGASAEILAVVRRTGTWGSNAQGIFVIGAVTSGPFQNGEALQVSAVTQATATSANSAITLQPGGRYEFEVYNFYGDSGSERMYGVDGTNSLFEFDGTTYVPIATGMASDTPNHVAAHNNHLFVSFGSSIQHSSPLDPYAFSVVLGAGEIATGDNVTGLMPQAGSSVGAEVNAAMLIVDRNRTYVLYGKDVDTWDLVSQEDESGCIEYTLQKIGLTYALDDFGIRAIARTAKYGNFDQSTVSQKIRDLIKSKITRAIDSLIIRKLNQYRIYFSDKTALHITVKNNKVVGMMPQRLSHQVTCSYSSETANGERAFFGCSDGYVYELEKGTSHDGDDISGYFRLAHAHMGSPTVNKLFDVAYLELKGSSYMSFMVGHELGYGESDVAQPADRTVTKSLSPALWDEFTWDNFDWDGRSKAPSRVKLNGRAENISLAVTAVSQVMKEFTILSAIIHYARGKRKR